MSKSKQFELEQLFSNTFLSSHNTLLKGGASEPVYIPAGYVKASDHVAPHLSVLTEHANVIFYREDFFRSALHEIAHWCIAGEQRREKLDFGYWYEADGRSQEQQAAFQRVEVKPQAIEYAFCQACKIEFRVSIDNINSLSDSSCEEQYKQEAMFLDEVSSQLDYYKEKGFPKRAHTFINALSNFYLTDISN